MSMESEASPSPSTTCSTGSVGRGPGWGQGAQQGQGWGQGTGTGTGPPGCAAGTGGCSSSPRPPLRRRGRRPSPSGASRTGTWGKAASVTIAPRPCHRLSSSWPPDVTTPFWGVPTPTHTLGCDGHAEILLPVDVEELLLGLQGHLKARQHCGRDTRCPPGHEGPRGLVWGHPTDPPNLEPPLPHRTVLLDFELGAEDLFL